MTERNTTDFKGNREGEAGKRSCSQIATSRMVRTDALLWYRRFVSSSYCVLHHLVFPQLLQRVKVLLRIGLPVSNIRPLIHRFEYQLRIRQIVLRHRQMHIYHSLQDRSHAICQVHEYELAVCFNLLRCEWHAMNQAHLLEEEL